MLVYSVTHNMQSTVCIKCLFVCLMFARVGDRLVKVNGESILGKTYSQVIALIQNR